LLLCRRPARATLTGRTGMLIRSGADCHNRLVRLVVLPELACTLTRDEALPRTACEALLS